MYQGYGQFCPIALASEVLAQRWMLLILHQLMNGSTRFNDIRRGVPRISATLLKQRLDTLETAEIIRKRALGDTGSFEYLLTEAGAELRDVLLGIGTWGQRWARDIRDEDLDPAWLVWNIHRRLDRSVLPADQTVIRIEFSDAEPRERLFWLVVTPEKVDICIKSPGYPEHLCIRSRVRVMAEVWRGIRSLRGALQTEDILLEGSATLRRSFPRWFLLSAVAGVKSQRHRLQGK